MQLQKLLSWETPKLKALESRTPNSFWLDSKIYIIACCNREKLIDLCSRNGIIGSILTRSSTLATPAIERVARVGNKMYVVK